MMRWSSSAIRSRRRSPPKKPSMTHSAAPAAKGWAEAFYLKAGATGLALADLNKIVQDSATMEAATDALLAATAARHAGALPGASGTKVGTEASEKFVTGVTKAMIGQVSMFNKPGKADPEGERNEFSGASLVELARMSLEARGIRNISRDRMTMVGQAFAPIVMAGVLTTSDFVNILANVANKSMLKGYEEAPENFDQWTSTGNLSDFKTTTRVDLGLFPSLALGGRGRRVQVCLAVRSQGAVAARHLWQAVPDQPPGDHQRRSERVYQGARQDGHRGQAHHRRSGLCRAHRQRQHARWHRAVPRHHATTC
jgi:hypothetical protein